MLVIQQLGRENYFSKQSSMKISRAKKAHKFLSFYANNFGFRQPYQILVDGTFCFHALKNKVNLQDQLPKYCGAELRLLTTSCVIIEVEKLGPTVYGAMLIVKQFPVHQCGHGAKPVSGSQCLLSMLGNKNKNRYIVATQDADLQQRVRNIPGAPLLVLYNKAPTLQAPSEVSKLAADKLNQAKFDPRKQPGEDIKEVRLRVLGEEEKTVRVNHKRKRPSGPNPLACKKKKVKSKPNLKQSSGVDKEKKKKRKRIKIAQHVKEHLKMKANV